MATTSSQSTVHRVSASFLFFFLFVAMAMSGPVKKHRNANLTCSRHCRVGQNSQFQYQPGHIYDYTYRVEVSSHFASTRHPSSTLVIEALANVHVISTCDMILKLREVRMMESDPTEGKGVQKSDNSKQFRQELEKEGLRFAFLDGYISDVCPSDAETTWALNVKKGFLSAFQNNMDEFNKAQSVVETDVLGTCHTVYHTSGTGWLRNTVKKSRDLSSCSSSSPQPADYSDVHALHSQSTLFTALLSGRQDCQQTIDWNGILSSVLCVERRHFQTSTGETSGAVTKVSQIVKFLQKRKRGKFFPPVYKRASLEYRPTTPSPEDTERETENSLRRVRAVLRQMCVISEVRPETPDLFYELVASIRQLSYPRLRLLFEKMSGMSFCSDHLRIKKHFLDALAMAGTEAAVHLLVKALTSRSQEPISAHFLITTLPLIPSITSRTLQAVKVLLEHRATSQVSLLPVSAMVHRYCLQYAHCATDSAVQRVMLHLRHAVGHQCYAKGVNAQRVLLGLRAMGNAGQTKRITEVLNTCLKRMNNPLHIRVAAAEAFRRLPCTASRKRAQEIFTDISEHTELRIASYLAMMQCPSTLRFLRLQRSLAAEANTQVLSFVVTHLRGLKDSRNEFRQDIERTLERIDSASEELGRFQLSRHFAGPVWSDTVRMASNLIWSSSSSSSSSSWLPRSFTTNLTLNILGQTVHLAELGVRGEGLEVLVGEVLWPMLDGKKPAMAPRKRQEKLARLKASVYARILGNELMHYQLSGTGSLMQQLTSGKLLSLKAVLSKIAAHGKTSYTQSLILMDQKVSVPTSSGLTLTVALNSTLTAWLHVQGIVDLRQAFTRPRSLHVQGSVQPSAALRVTGSVTVDGIVTRTGLRMSGSAQTSSVVKGRVQIERGKVVTVELDTPRDNMTILAARTEITFIHGKKQRPLTLTSEEQHVLKTCTGPAGIRLTGLDLCGEVHVPKFMASGLVFPPFCPVRLLSA